MPYSPERLFRVCCLLLRLLCQEVPFVGSFIFAYGSFWIWIISELCSVDWTKSETEVKARLKDIRKKLKACTPRVWPVQNIDPDR